MVYAAKRGKSRCPTHPGALLRDDIIPATGRTKAEIAGLLGISRQHLYDILRERKPVSPAVAVRLGKLFGDGAGIWTRMQAAYDTWHAERTEDVSHIPDHQDQGRLRQSTKAIGSKHPPISRMRDDRELDQLPRPGAPLPVVNIRPRGR